MQEAVGPRTRYHKDSMTPESKASHTPAPRILDGIAIAAGIKAEVAEQVRALAPEGVTPGLAVILVGEVPASQIYVRSKVRPAVS